MPAKGTRVYTRKLDGKREAKLIALACGKPPAGKTRWTLRLLADREARRGPPLTRCGRCAADAILASAHTRA